MLSSYDIYLQGSDGRLNFQQSFHSLVAARVRGVLLGAQARRHNINVFIDCGGGELLLLDPQCGTWSPFVPAAPTGALPTGTPAATHCHG